MNIRQANKSDREVLLGLCEFIESLDIDLIKKVGKEKFFEILKECYESEEDRYSYKNCKLIEEENRVLAFYFSYDYNFMINSKKYWENKVISKYNLDEEDVIFGYDEVLEGEYYLDILYVFEDSRSRGFGTKLIEDFLEFDHRKKSLNVAENNPRARKLYESFGMVASCEIEIANYRYYHMVIE